MVCMGLCMGMPRGVHGCGMSLPRMNAGVSSVLLFRGGGGGHFASVEGLTVTIQCIGKLCSSRGQQRQGGAHLPHCRPAVTLPRTSPSPPRPIGRDCRSCSMGCSHMPWTDEASPCPHTPTPRRTPSPPPPPPVSPALHHSPPQAPRTSKPTPQAPATPPSAHHHDATRPSFPQGDPLPRRAPPPAHRPGEGGGGTRHCTLHRCGPNFVPPPPPHPLL